MNNRSKFNSQLLEPLKSILGDADDPELPWLDGDLNHDENLTDFQKSWRDDGIIVAGGLLPNQVIDDYREEWLLNNRQNKHINKYGGWENPCPYMHTPSLLKLATHKPIHDILESIIGEPMGVHLALTGWKSTERQWHQDNYLNPPHVKSWYVAIWVALDDIHEDAGPFEFIRGSHALPPIEGDKVVKEFGLDVHDPTWPKQSEIALTPLVDAFIEKSSLKVEQFVPKKGDILFWHSRLLHRGSKPKKIALWRESVILHYSGINHRKDMPPAKQYNNSGWYFPIILENSGLGQHPAN